MEFRDYLLKLAHDYLQSCDDNELFSFLLSQDIDVHDGVWNCPSDIGVCDSEDGDYACFDCVKSRFSDT